MVFVEENSLYRKFTRTFHILAAATALSLAYNYTSKSDTNKNESIFKSCTYANVFFLLSWAINLGITFWVSFVAGPVMIKNLNRHVFAHIQSHLFPIYFFIQGLTSFIQLAIFLFLNSSISSFSRQDMLVFASLDAGLLCGILNGMWFGPKLNKISMKRVAMEKEEGVVSPNIGPKLKENAEYQAVMKKFGMYHGGSTLLNLFSLAGNFYVLYFLSRELFVAGKSFTDI